MVSAEASPSPLSPLPFYFSPSLPFSPWLRRANPGLFLMATLSPLRRFGGIYMNQLWMIRASFDPVICESLGPVVPGIKGSVKGEVSDPCDLIASL